VTPGTTPLDQWLFAATKGLSKESAAQVRAEIQEHYDSSREAGGAAADVMRALGDPRTANRGYRRVLLTKRETWMARDLAKPKRPPYLLAGFIFWLSGQHASSAVPITISTFSTAPLAWFFPMLEHSRVYVYLHSIRLVLGVAAVWWYSGWISGLVLGAVLFLWDYSTIYRRQLIIRKLGLRTCRP
jgi:hypothetical protein